MADVVAPRLLRDNGTYTSDSQAYVANEVVIAACVNSTPAPTQPCQVALELSTDDVAWDAATSGGRRQFGPVEGELYLRSFALGAFSEAKPWKYYRLVFAGNVGGACAIAASIATAPDLATDKVEELFKADKDDKDTKDGKHAKGKDEKGHDPHKAPEHSKR